MPRRAHLPDRAQLPGACEQVGCQGPQAGRQLRQAAQQATLRQCVRVPRVHVAHHLDAVHKLDHPLQLAAAICEYET